MVDVPGLTPLILPVVNPAVAIPVLLLVHVPPPPASLKLVVPPWHRESTPEIVDSGSTVTTVVTSHPPNSA